MLYYFNEWSVDTPSYSYFLYTPVYCCYYRVREVIHKHIYPAVTGKLVHPIKSSRVTSVVRNKRRDKVDTILTQVILQIQMSILYSDLFWDSWGENSTTCYAIASFYSTNFSACIKVVEYLQVFFGSHIWFFFKTDTWYRILE